MEDIPFSPVQRARKLYRCVSMTWSLSMGFHSKIGTYFSAVLGTLLDISKCYINDINR